jgi:prolyl-tRNA synthetase
VHEGEPCPSCGAALRVAKTIEVGHIFKLGTPYSEKLGATVLDREGKAVPVVMGSYGIGIGRTMAAVAERCHDENGLLWPVSLAPFEVVVSVLNPTDPRTGEVGARLYEALRAAGVDALLDDRDERPGVKFKDAELIGIPYRLTVGPKGLEQGKVELVRRRGGARRDVDVAKAADHAIESVLEERR